MTAHSFPNNMIGVISFVLHPESILLGDSLPPSQHKLQGRSKIYRSYYQSYTANLLSFPSNNSEEPTTTIDI